VYICSATLVFTVEDRYLIIIMQKSKGNAVTRLWKMLSEKRWNVNGLETLIKKLITLALSIDCKVPGAYEGPTCTSVADCT